MSRAYAYCLDCCELTFGVLDQAKGFRANAGTNTHWDHNVKPFGDVAALPRPIFNAISRLGAGLPMSDNHITLFRLGLDLEDYPTGAAACPPAPSSAPAAESTSPMSPAPAQESGASTRSARASRPTSDTSAPREPDLFDLIGGVA